MPSVSSYAGMKYKSGSFEKYLTWEILFQVRAKDDIWLKLQSALHHRLTAYGILHRNRMIHILKLAKNSLRKRVKGRYYKKYFHSFSRCEEEARRLAYLKILKSPSCSLKRLFLDEYPLLCR